MSVRKEFVKLLFDEMEKNSDIYFITGDLGYGHFDHFRDKFGDRFINVGAAEQLLVGVGIGLAMEGKIPICYSMTPFVIYRPFEFIRNYINYENIPVKLIGAGRNKDYSHDGISHWAEDDEEILSCFKNIKIFKPMSDKELIENFEEMLYNNKPCYLNLIR